MINGDIGTWLYQQSWLQFCELQNQKRILEKKVGRKVSDIEHKVLSCIADCPATRNDLLTHKYFLDVSLSTIKRAVNALLEYGVIEVKVDKKDRRKKVLKFKG